VPCTSYPKVVCTWNSIFGGPRLRAHGIDHAIDAVLRFGLVMDEWEDGVGSSNKSSEGLSLRLI
jgi:hypothetical protein